MAAIALSRAQNAVDVASHNISNVSSNAYKRRSEFDSYFPAAEIISQKSQDVESSVDFSPGKAILTSNPYDLLIKGDSFFVVKDGDNLIYTRDGQFHRDDAGHLLNIHGQILQADGGGDVMLTKDGFALRADGSIVEEGQAVQRIALVEFDDKNALKPVSNQSFTGSADLAQPADNPSVQQGALESSNVSTGDEMVSMMAALRRAETGQRLVQVYDDLMGRALTVFGGG